MNSNLSYTHDNSETESFDISSRNTPYSTSSFAIGIISIFFILTIMMEPSHGANWVEVEVGEDSGDTYLWPYFYTASRYIDVESIKKTGDNITYVELINAKKAISANVSSLVVSKKSNCGGKKVVWQKFAIYKAAMAKGKPIMRLNPNETEIFRKGGSGALADAFACSFEK